MNYRNLFRSALLVFSMLLIVSCSKDGDDNVDPNAQTYNTTVEVTDAPIDNANVKGAFVTITNVKIDGKAIEGFQTTTVDLLALQNGKTEALGNLMLESGTTSSIVVEVDNEFDDNGNKPGNYILTATGEKKALVAESAEIALTNAKTQIEESNDNTVVLDFDLRKMIVTDSQTGDFKFVSSSQMQSSIRAVSKNNTGKIEGSVQDTYDAAGTILVYAYKKGTYSADETNENTNGVRFAGAVNSSVASETTGAYSLHFLEEGEYELHYASYQEEANGEMSFKGMLTVDSVTDLDLSLLNISANGNITVNVLVTGMVQ